MRHTRKQGTPELQDISPDRTCYHKARALVRLLALTCVHGYGAALQNEAQHRRASQEMVTCAEVAAEQGTEGTNGSLKDSTQLGRSPQPARPSLSLGFWTEDLKCIYQSLQSQWDHPERQAALQGLSHYSTALLDAFQEELVAWGVRRPSQQPPRKGSSRQWQN
ncbi:Hypothetical predicted protein [Marmota monax]|uniref:Uncharacterized protein n=1 Tax=Marmota monax TaxID=9995 RepID=A0A5E4BDB0_MARMO|nr:Hypothetical predicted protein [Marmota monax]